MLVGHIPNKTMVSFAKIVEDITVTIQTTTTAKILRGVVGVGDQTKHTLNLENNLSLIDKSFTSWNFFYFQK